MSIRSYYLIFSSILFSPFLFAADRMLVAGDSWAVLMCMHNSAGSALSEVKAPIVADVDCVKASANGAEARTWIGRSTDATIKSKLTSDSELKYLVLSLGGNDLVRQWNKEMTSEQEAAVIGQVFENTKKIVTAYAEIRPDVKIIISGYDFPRFQKNHPLPAYNKLYLSMKSPSPLELNSAMIRFTAEIMKIANKTNIFYVHHLGMSHYYDGSEEDGLPALTTLAPDFISSWENPLQTGGDINIMSSAKSLDNRFGFIDPYHLSKSGFHHLILHIYSNVIAHLN